MRIVINDERHGFDDLYLEIKSNRDEYEARFFGADEENIIGYGNASDPWSAIEIAMLSVENRMMELYNGYSEIAGIPHPETDSALSDENECK